MSTRVCLCLKRLMEPMQLSEEQLAEYRAKLSVPRGASSEAFPSWFKIPFMTFVCCLCDLLGFGGDSTLVRQLWSHFCLPLRRQKTEFSLSWSRSETVVSCEQIPFSCFFFHFSFCFYGNAMRIIHDYYSSYVIFVSVFPLSGPCSAV